MPRRGRGSAPAPTPVREAGSRRCQCPLRSTDLPMTQPGQRGRTRGAPKRKIAGPFGDAPSLDSATRWGYPKVERPQPGRRGHAGPAALRACTGGGAGRRAPLRQSIKLENTRTAGFATDGSRPAGVNRGHEAQSASRGRSASKLRKAELDLLQVFLATRTEAGVRGSVRTSRELSETQRGNGQDGGKSLAVDSVQSDRDRKVDQTSIRVRSLARHEASDLDRRRHRYRQRTV